MSAETEKKLGLIQTGRVADILLEQFSQRIAARKEIAIKRLAQAHRAGTATQAEYAAGMGAYCALEDLHTDLVKESTKGHTAQKEINDVRESGPGNR